MSNTRNNQHDYGAEFEEIYTGIPRLSSNNTKMACFKMYMRMKKRAKAEIEEIKKELYEEPQRL